MPIPDYQTLMLPLLRAAQERDAKSQSDTKIADVVSELADAFQLSDEERAELLPSGRQTIFSNRVHWAKAYLSKAELIESTGRGVFRLTQAGTQVLNDPPARIDNQFLEKFAKFRAFRDRAAESDTAECPANGAAPPKPASPVELTPDDAMRAAQTALDAQLAGELLDRILASTPEFFERLVVNLLTAMGYGGSTHQAARALGKSGDGGVDGVIDQDPLGLDRIYVQAKRYARDNSVGAGAIRDFFGALDHFKANKGLFVTTSAFTSSAHETAKLLSKRIVLIDGVQLTRLMIHHEVGCRIEETLFIKRLDEEFFE